MAKKASSKTITKHFLKLQSVANKNRGVLPSFSALNRRGLFYTYEVVRKAGLLSKFKRVNLLNGSRT